jgi:hypothetical protein
MVADVECDRQVEGLHYRNVMPGGFKLDLTRDQFVASESLVNERRVGNKRNASATAREQAFQLLRVRVLASLGLPSDCASRG